MVLGALARPAGDDDGMVVAGGVGEGGGHKLGPVGEDAEIGGARPGRADEARKHRRVGVIDLARLESAAGTNDLVSGRDDGDFERRIAGENVAPRRRGGGHLLRPQPHAGPGDHIARFAILAREPAIGALLEAGRNDGDDALAAPLDPHILLHRHGVEP